MKPATFASVMLLALSSPGVAAEPPADPPAEETRAEPGEKVPEKVATGELAAEAPDEETSGWESKYEHRIASGDRICTVAKPGFNFALFLIERGGNRYQAIKVGHSKHRDAYLRINSNPPLKLENGLLTRPARGDRLIGALAGVGGTLYIEWTDVRRGTQQEEASLEGFGAAHAECVRQMGPAFR